ncbi:MULTISPECIES: hypothetical protein [unclassified Spiroplasma]
MKCPHSNCKEKVSYTIDKKGFDNRILRTYACEKHYQNIVNKYKH